MNFIARAAIALFAMGWTIARAVIQTVTIDEAATYLAFVARGRDALWHPASNNHLLNTILMWASVSLLGASDLSIRIPALLGAAVYISSAYSLCRLLKANPVVEVATFAAMVLNPFVMDYMVAARGYSLATGFLVSGIAFAAHGRSPAFASVCLALSFISNFSFAIVDGCALALAGWLAWESRESTLRWVAGLVVPGVIVSTLAMPTLLRWPRGELYFGAQSLLETLQSVADASFWRTPAWVGTTVLVTAGVLAIVQLGLIVSGQVRWNPVGAGVLTVAVASLAIHWVLFLAIQLPLPKDRTALYMVPLVTFSLGALAASDAWTGFSGWSRQALACTLLVAVAAFLSCLRLREFKEWWWDSDVREGYAVLARYNHQHCATLAESDWRYATPLNYYRATSGKETLPEFAGPIDTPLPEDRDIYVLHAAFDREFIERQQLNVIFGPGKSQMVVAIRPGLDSRPPCAPQ